jgi:hypothetical protein
MCYYEQLAHFSASVERANTVTASSWPWLCHTYYVTICAGKQQLLLYTYLLVLAALLLHNSVVSRA